MERIYIEITRQNNEIDFYRFELSHLKDNHLKRAWSFLTAQLFINDNVKVWRMTNIPTLNISEYDLIED